MFKIQIKRMGTIETIKQNNEIKEKNKAKIPLKRR